MEKPFKIICDAIWCISNFLKVYFRRISYIQNYSLAFVKYYLNGGGVLDKQQLSTYAKRAWKFSIAENGLLKGTFSKKIFFNKFSMEKLFWCLNCMIWRKQMLIFWQIPVITKQCFQNIRRTFHKFLFQKYSKDIPEIL